MSSRAARQRLTIKRLRTILTVALVVGISAFTGVTLVLVGNLSERFGPEVRADLEWRALRGAQELARATDVGLAVEDAAVVTQAFGFYAASDDVQAIVALGVDDKVVARHGTIDAPSSLFAGPPGVLMRAEASM